MKDVKKDNTKTVTKTCGIGSFGEGPEGKTGPRLFRVQAGHDGDYAIEQAMLMVNCVYKLTYEASIEPSEMHIYAAHCISGMAKALIEDIAHGMLVSPDGAGNAPTPAPGA